MVKFSREDVIPTLIPAEVRIVEVGGAISGFDMIAAIDRGGNGQGKGKK